MISVVASLAWSSQACRTEKAEAAYVGVVDSVVPRDVAIERFRHGLQPVDSLAGTEPSRDALVRAFLRAVEHHDTLALRRMALTRAEFAYLVYPTSPQGLPPYDMTPSLMWFTLEGRSRQGIGALLQARGGSRMRTAGYRCDTVPSREGDNVIWGPCELRVIGSSGDTTAERLFGQIIERHGRFKFVSYANRL